MSETNELSHNLLRASRGSGVSPEMLEVMGKQAAAGLTSNGTPLARGIAKIASQNPGMTNEQIKRVCEAANTAVYLDMHEKRAGAESSYPQFELADPVEVIRTLDRAANPVKTAEVDSSYARPPERKQLFSNSQSMSLLAEMFGQEKNASAAPVDPEFAARQAVRAQQDLEDLRGKIRYDIEANDIMLKEASASYYDTVKRHLLDGHSFSGVMAAARSTGADTEKIAGVVRPLVTALLAGKVASADSLHAGVLNLEKIAHRVVNDKHPLVSSFGAVLGFQSEIEKLASSLAEVEGELSKITAVVRERYHAARR